MKNPCNGCKNSYKHIGLNSFSFHPMFSSDYCKRCEKRPKYTAYKKSKRKYKPGDAITNLSQYITYAETHTHIMFHDTTLHIEVVNNWQLNQIKRCLNNGVLFEAIGNRSEVNKQ